MSALDEAAQGGGDLTSLLDAFETFDQLEADVSVPRLRPNLNLGRGQLAAIRKVSEGLDRFVDSLAASGIEEAQELEAQGQALLDAGAADLDPTRHDLVRAKGDEGLSFLEAMGVSHAELMSTDSITELSKRLPLLTGLPGEDVALHVAVEGLDVAASTMDRERVLRLSEAADQILALRPEVLDGAGVLTELLEALLQIDARGATMITAVEAQEDELTLTSLALDLVKAVRERGLRAAVLPLIAAKTGDQVEHLQRERSGALLNRASRLMPQLELSYLDRSLRDSGAHEDFRVEAGMVLLERGQVRLAVEELLDRVLQTNEFFVGMTRGILVAMARSDRTLPEVYQLSPRVRLELTRYLSGLQGLEEVEISQEDEVATLSAVGTVTSWPKLVAVLSPLFAEEVSVLQGRFRTDAGRVIQARAEMDAYRSLTIDSVEQPECCATLLNFLPVMAATRYGGESPFSTEDWYRAAVHLVYEHVEEVPLVTRLRRGRQAQRLATRAESDTQRIQQLLARARDPEGVDRKNTSVKLWHVPLPGAQDRTSVWGFKREP